MAASRTSFEKLQRDRAKKAKAAAKREKRLEKGTDPVETDEVLDTSTLTAGEEIPADQLLRMVAELHEHADSLGKYGKPFSV